MYSFLQSRLTWKWRKKLTKVLHDKYFQVMGARASLPPTHTHTTPRCPQRPRPATRQLARLAVALPLVVPSVGATTPGALLAAGRPMLCVAEAEQHADEAAVLWRRE